VTNRKSRKHQWGWVESQKMVHSPGPATVIISLLVAVLWVADGRAQSKPENVQWWRDAKLGMFVHWGPVSLKGTEITCSRAERPADFYGTSETIPVEEYDNLYKQFNPTKFDAREWVRIAKAMGAGYIVFTTKHGDGFCEFDSKLTDYKITNTPFKRDVTAELANSCHECEMGLGFYYAPPDLHHPDFRTAYHQRYVEYMHGQIRELCTNYGKVDIIWFDSLPEQYPLWDSPQMFRIIRQLQPHALINNRGGLLGDFDTPEQEVGKFQSARPWESCITIGEQWSYKPDDKLKSVQECVQTLVRCVCGDGNLLLNVGPMPTGEIEPRQVQRLTEIGRWLGHYGKAIYGTRGGPFVMGSRGGSTYKDEMIYLHILDWPDDVLRLPAIGARIVSSRPLTGGAVDIRQGESGIEVFVPEKERDPIDTIIALKLDKPASQVEPVRCYLSLTMHKQVTASSSGEDTPDYCCVPQYTVDDDFLTRWQAGVGVRQAWLEVDLGAPTTFDRAFISEEYDRVREFELQYRDGDNWRVLARGTTIGKKLSRSFRPVTARFVRLNILKATDSPSIWEFQLMAK